MYPTYYQLRAIVARQAAVYSVMDSSLLNNKGRLTRDMWRYVEQAFRPATCLDDALTNLSCAIDELAEKRSLALFDSRYIRDLIHNLLLWVHVHVDRGIWEQYPALVNPYT